MFVYCLNNPVNHADEGGVYADSYAGWCGMQIGIWFYELFTGNDHPHHQTEALEREVIETQTEIIIDTTAEVGKSLWEAHEQNVKLEAERQYQQDMRVREYFGFFRENPLVGIDLATGIIGIETTYVGICATAGLVSIPVAGQVGLGIIGLACGLWGLGRLIAAIPSN